MWKSYIIFFLLIIVSCSKDNIDSSEFDAECVYEHSNKFDSISFLMKGTWNLSLVQIHKENKLIAAIETFNCENIPFDIENDIYTKLNIDKNFKILKQNCHNNSDNVYWQLTWLQTPDELFHVLFNINEYNSDCTFKQKIIIKPSSNDLRLNYSIDDYYVNLLYIRN